MNIKADGCACDDGAPDIDTDWVSSATFIECLQCRRVVCGMNRDEALVMWNGAMAAIRTAAN